MQEIAALFHIHKNIVRLWIKNGLHADKVRGEYLVLGRELVQFLSEHQQKKQRKCATNEFFCFKCHAQRRAYLDIADVVIISPGRFRVKGLCEVCSTRINKVQGIKKLQNIQDCFHIQQIEGLHIIERSDSIVNSDMEAHT